MKTLLYMIIIISSNIQEIISELPVCADDLITYAYTECDKDNGRWRVAVPRNNECQIKDPTGPIRGKDCDFSCKPGEYLDLNEQECRRCPQGTYSLGSGIRFNIWNEIPEGFRLSSSSVSFAEYGYHSRVDNCSGSTWKPQKDYISSNDDDCTSSISYTANVRNKGSVTFKYQYTDEDIIFHFYIQNGECETQKGNGRNVFLNTTGTSWSTYKAELSVGTNVLYWKSTGILLSKKQKVSPVLIKDIEITGVSYTTHCHKCLEGYHSDTEASQWCKPCPENTYSGLGAKKCTACDTATEYAPKTSSSCLTRPPCTEKDYFETHTPCDQNKTTKAMYKWIEPSACNKDNTDSIKLPKSGAIKECSPCNPGFTPTESGRCVPCTDGMYSDGKKECQQCPANTAPVYGFNYIWWDDLPQNMNISCLTVHSDQCIGRDGWHPGGSMIESSQGQIGNAYLVLVLHIDGFRKPTVKPDGNEEYGTVTFAFELFCKENCVLYFMKEVHGKGTNVIDSWHGNRQKKTYSYTVLENKAITFTWAFQKTSSNTEEEGDMVKNDKAQIYLINVSNALNAPASECKSCASGVDKNGCIPCPSGHYVEESSKECKLCSEGTFINPENNNNKCQSCATGTSSNSERTACLNDCTFTSSLTGRNYDFSTFSEPQIVSTPPSFTNSGRKYIHYYNISLCGNNGFGAAECIDNVSLSRGHLLDTEPSNKVRSMVCRSTKTSSIGGNGEEVPVFSQPQDISSYLSEVYQSDKNVTNEESMVFPLPKSQEYGDVIYTFTSYDESAECTDGVKTFVHLRCDSTLEEGVVVTETPSSCPDGTCDNCAFHFLWKSVEACPSCTPDDYSTIESGCKDGAITTKYIWKSYPKSCQGGVKLPDYAKTPCMDLKLYIEIGVLGGIVLLTILCIVMCCLWKKSKKLEYKYQKLVMSSTLNDGELPTAETCAISDSESDDGVGQSDEIVFQKKRARILGKNNLNNYESVSLKPMHQNV